MAEQNFIGIEIGGTKLQLAIADKSLKIEQQLSFEVNRNKGADGIKQQIEKSIHQLKGNKKVCAIGVGFGGPVNYKTGTINVSHQIQGWENFDLRNGYNKLAMRRFLLTMMQTLLHLAKLFMVQVRVSILFFT